MIVIVGDSWSCDTQFSLSGLELYHPRLSIRSQLEQMLPGETVVNLAQHGATDLGVARRLVEFMDVWSSIDRICVLWGWTDSIRSMFPNGDWRNPEQARSKRGNLQGDLQVARETIRDTLDVPRLDRCEFYHWGGQGSFWIRDVERLPLTQRHTLITEDFAHEFLGAPPNASGITSSFGNRGCILDVHKLWPNTTPEELDDLLDNAHALHNYKLKNHRKFPDAAHPAYALYTPMLERFCEQISAK